MALLHGGYDIHHPTPGLCCSQMTTRTKKNEFCDIAVIKTDATAPYLLSILRIIAAFVYMVHGTQKLFGFPAPFPMPHLPPLFLAGGIIETFGGLLLLLGLFTQPVAFILSGEMAVAYFKFHAPQGFWPLLNDGEAAVLYCFIFLFLASAGGGPWSLDRLLRKRASTV